MGSVKDLEILQKPTQDALGKGVFTFSDRYSVFDWGEMPDHIHNKGTALCMMAAWNFERIQEMGIQTHYKGLLDENGQLAKTANLTKPSNKMVVDLTNVHYPRTKTDRGRLTYDYSLYQKGGLYNYLVPLEIIFRNGFPLGSSVFDKLEKGIITVADLGLKQRPKPGDMLKEPIIEFTTKLEESDRALSFEEAQMISGLDSKRFEELVNLARKVNRFITSRAKEVDLIHFDGKIEVFYFKELVVCDVIGTFDEDRFMMDGQQVSKEVLRQWYKTNQPEWKSAVDVAKKEAMAQGTQNWQKLCKVQPHKLSQEILQLISQIYMAGTNLYTGTRFFDVLDLRELIQKLKKAVD